MKLALNLLAIVFLASSSPVLAGEGGNGGNDGHGAPPPEAKVYVKKKAAKKSKKVVVVHKKTPVVVAKPAIVHKRRVVVHSAPVVVRPIATVPAKKKVVVEEQSYPRRHPDESMLGVGVRLSGTAVEGGKLNLATVENPTMWGLGLQFRGKVSPTVGLELSADWLTGVTDELTQTTVPIMLSMLYYFTPRSPLKLYGLLGVGVHLTKLEYDVGFRHDLVELGGQLGGGLELRLSREFALNADLRFLGLYKNIGTASSIEDRCMKDVGGQGGFCSGASQIDPNDKFNVGAQFLVGASLYF